MPALVAGAKNLTEAQARLFPFRVLYSLHSRRIADIKIAPHKARAHFAPR